MRVVYPLRCSWIWKTSFGLLQWQRSRRAAASFKRGEALADKLIVYSHPDCGYSDALKEELDAAEAVYEEIDLALHPEEWTKLEALTGGEG